MENIDIRAGRKAFSRIGFAVVLFLVITQAIQFVALFIFGYDLIVYSRWFQYVMMLAQYLIAMPLAGLLIYRMPVTSAGRRNLKAGELIIIFLICCGILYSGNLLGRLIDMAIAAAMQSTQGNIIDDVILGMDIWAILGIAVVLAPVAEELFFRKLLIPRLLPYGEKPAILASGLAFALIHGNMTQFFYAFGMGLALGYIFVKTGKVIYTIGLHILVNFIGGFIASLVLSAHMIVQALWGMLVIAFMIAGVVLFFVYRKRIALNRGLLVEPGGRSAVFGNAGMVTMYVVGALLFVMVALSAYGA